MDNRNKQERCCCWFSIVSDDDCFFIYLYARRWLINPKLEAQSLEQCGHVKSVVVITAVAAW